MADKPGLLVHNASEIATLAGGVRRGASQGEVALLTADGDGDDGSQPALAAYEGRIVAIGRLRRRRSADDRDGDRRQCGDAAGR